ncbi:MAG: Hpt domain-containing protein [Pseudomonadales bacterium]|nr:Hpt domain-containing protein [Pseudomonadales bacterium]
MFDDDDEAPVWDKEAALQRVRGKEKFLVSLVELFLKDMPARIDDLEKTVANMDVPEVQSIGHAVKGVAANLSSIALSEFASKIEQAAKKNHTEAIEMLMPKLRDAHTDVTDMFTEYLASK